MVSAAADAIINARNIELYAAGGSNIICEDFQHKLLRFGVRANVPRDRHLMLMSASVLNEQDVVLVVSHSGQTVDLMDAVRMAKQAGLQLSLSPTITMQNLLSYRIIRSMHQHPLSHYWVRMVPHVWLSWR
ncbi:transcriptional regulator RpiR family [Vibrio variabilis]|uniref:Transcriptional regulator RpiR family n=1 Tax=Vibrio variabilis TaxID=990271 RepID=A0ABQ0J777_9VIBR|nr:transcriptional regulator RpiR family [Vibrio variabilis]